jgi:hypothetical protein
MQMVLPKPGEGTMVKLAFGLWGICFYHRCVMKEKR